MRISGGLSANVRITDGVDFATIIPADATIDETLARYLTTLTAIYGFDGVDELRRVIVDTSGRTVLVGAAAHDAAAAGDPVLMAGIHTATPAAVAGGDVARLLTDPNGRLEVVPGGIWTFQEDTTLNDSDKTITVPAGESWRLVAMTVRFNATATVGNRRVLIEMSSGSVLIQASADLLIAANGSVVATFLASGATRSRNTANEENDPLPDIWLPPAGTIRVFDSSVVDVAADDMILDFVFQLRQTA